MHQIFPEICFNSKIDRFFPFIGIFFLFFISIFIWKKKGRKKDSMGLVEKKAVEKALDICNDAVLIVQDTMKIEYANAAMRKLLGLKDVCAGEELDATVMVKMRQGEDTLLHLIEESRVLDNTRSCPLTNADIISKESKNMYSNIRIDTVSTQERRDEIWSVVSLQNLHEKQEKENAQYYHRLTGLPNQTKALIDINALNAKLHLLNKKVAFLVINIDKLSSLRSVIGYKQTDSILKNFSSYLVKMGTARGFTVYHTFYNNFLLMAPEVEGEEEVLEWGNMIENELKTFYKLGGNKLYLSASIGISLYPDHGALSNILDNAFKALSEAERNGYGYIKFYKPQMNKYEFDELSLYNEMHKALESNQFEVYYQAIVDAKSNEVASAEALIRWHHPKYGMVPPDFFIPIMEKTGFIVEMGRFVLDEVLKQQKRWEVFKFRQIAVSINLSLLEIETEDFLEYLMERLEYHKVDPELIRYEITEGLSVEDEGKTSYVFQRMKKEGIGIVLDDFGTGYTSYAYLKKFPASILKIDKTLVDRILTIREDQHIVRSIIELGHQLKMKIVIEGIEDKNMANLLMSYGADYFQGYYFAKPLPVFEFQKMLRK